MIGDVLMSTGGGAVDQFGVRWLLEKVIGWDGSPGSTSETQQRSADHGSWASLAHLAQRVIQVEGSFSADWTTANAAKDRLLAAVPVSDLAPLVLVGAGAPMTTMVRQEGEFNVEGNQATTRFSFSLLAPDPRKYGVEASAVETGLPSSSGGLSLPLSLPLSVGGAATSGVLTVVNEGNIASPVMLTVSGPCPPFEITRRGSGETLRFPDSLAAGRTVVIDGDRRRALLDGTVLTLLTGSWFDLEPGVNEIAFSAASYNPSARARSESRSAWR